MNDYSRQHDNVSPSTQADFEVADSYHWVRLGLYFLMAGYLLMAPGLVCVIAWRIVYADAESGLPLVLGGVLAIFVSALLVVIGGFLLLKSPRENERAAIKKFLVAYGIAIGCLIVARALDIAALGMVQRIAQAWGTYYLINFLEVLAVNRQNDPLKRSSAFLNWYFLIVILAIVALAFAGGVIGVPPIITLIGLGIFGVVFYCFWIRMLWLGIKSTKFIPADSIDHRWA